MTHHTKMKRWKKALIAALIALGIAILAFPFSMIGYQLLAEVTAERDFCLVCLHKLKPIVSAELVSQEKPLAFFELLEQPKIEGIKVKLTYKNGRSRVVDAYDMKSHDLNHSYYHDKGMFFATRPYYTDPSQPAQPALEPGLQQIPMYCVDRRDCYYGDGPDAFCMVEVYAQTPEEYLAEHSPPLVTATEIGGGTLSMKKYEKGLIKLLAKESGTYTFQVEGKFTLEEAYTAGSGTLAPTDYNSCNRYFTDENKYSVYDYSVQLTANEPLYLRAYGPYSDYSGHLQITKLTPEDITP